MKAQISNFRMSRHGKYDNHMVVSVEGVDNKEKAEKLVGKEVSYNTGKKEIKGTVKSTHGNKGAVRVLFEKGMPGQSLGQEIKIN